MELKQLAALVAVGEHRSFSAAARALHTVQSNISSHIARLERELDVVLVDRSTGELTEEGRIVVGHARLVQAELDGLVSDISSLRGEISGLVRLGVIGTTARWLVPPLVEALADRHPRIRLVVFDGTTTAQLLQLRSGQLDLSVLSAPVDDPDVSLEPLFDEERVLVVPNGHALAEHDELNLSDVVPHELLLEARGTQFREELDDLTARLGITLRTKAEVDGVRLLATLAFSGFGAAILPASAAPGGVGADWKRIALHQVPGRSVGLAHRSRGLRSAADRAVSSTIRDVVTQLAPAQFGIHPVADHTVGA